MKKFLPKNTPQAEFDALAKTQGLSNLDTSCGATAATRRQGRSPSGSRTRNGRSSLPGARRSARCRSRTSWSSSATRTSGRSTRPATSFPTSTRFSIDLFDNQEVFNLWIVSGKIDCQYRYTDPGAYTLYKENEAKGGYKVHAVARRRGQRRLPQHQQPRSGAGQAVRHAEVPPGALHRHQPQGDQRPDLQRPVQRRCRPARSRARPTTTPDFEKKWAEYDPKTAGALLDELG